MSTEGYVAVENCCKKHTVSMGNTTILEAEVATLNYIFIMELVELYEQ